MDYSTMDYQEILQEAHRLHDDGNYAAARDAYTAAADKALFKVNRDGCLRSAQECHNKAVAKASTTDQPQS